MSATIPAVLASVGQRLSATPTKSDALSPQALSVLNAVRFRADNREQKEK